ncbi:AAC(3) family N-acetyltransferase [Kitasatospora sp. NPDC048545]|uniref:AAC(3) family N-acetyltransferase n=1 Tax=Kitasatospora sp. NPDC048545 TaxID=3157208 RepID=UPI00340AE726
MRCSPSTAPIRPGGRSGCALWSETSMLRDRLPLVTAAELRSAFRKVGLDSGGTVYAAASLAGLAAMADPAPVVLDALRATVGPLGTIVMPSFHPGFRYEGLFDPDQTPSRSGILSEHFRTRPGTVRTWAPPFNPVCVEGPGAGGLSAISSPTAFGPGSVFDRLVEIDATVLLIGCSFHDGVSHVHWLEERHDVPYRTWREISGQVVLNGKTITRGWPCHIRRPGVELHAGVVGEQLAAAGAIRQVDTGLTRISAFSLQDFAAVLDPWFGRNRECMVLL